MLHTPEALPDFPLSSSGEASRRFLALGLDGFRDAARHVHQLPYGRNTDRSDHTLVLGEGRGTCSTKHALLARLAAEQDRTDVSDMSDVSLTLGIYVMTGGNTPGTGPVFSRYNLSGLPEAHCYLAYAGTRVDLTSPAGPPVEPVERFLREETIAPEDIGEYKVALHERFLEEWSEGPASGGYGWYELLAIREECIAALS